MNLLDQTPKFSTTDAASIAKEHFGIDVEECQPLDSERDQNFLVREKEGRKSVLKISNANESRAFLVAQNAMMGHLAGPPFIKPGKSGQPIVTVNLADQEHLVRLVSWVQGKPMSKCNFVSASLLGDLGRCVAERNNQLADFQNDAFHRDFHWDLANAEQVIGDRIGLVEDANQKELIKHFLIQFKLQTKPLLEKLPRSIIHNDASDGNVIVAESDSSQVGQVHPGTVTGIIDFGDAVYTYTIADLAIAVAYAILNQQDPLTAAATMLRSYHALRPASEVEIECLFGLICMRLCSSVAIAAEQIRAQPENKYLLVSQEPIRQTLPKLAGISFPFAKAFFRNCVGLAAHPNTESVCRWLKTNSAKFAFPVNPVAAGVRPKPKETLVMDLGVESHLIPANIDTIIEPQLTQIVFEELKRQNAIVGIGRYREPRILYSSDQFASPDLSIENRTIHLGIDIFAETGTDLVAPIDGTVHYAGAINKPLDYGGLILLKHRTDDNEAFFTLYGHLDPSSFAHLKVGDAVTMGQKIAQLGAPEVNGGWTPHLHFQWMVDLLDLHHDFPGVAFASQLETWSAISPDPNIILGIEQSCFPKQSLTKKQTLQNRQRRIGPSLSIGYENHLKIVRGWKQYLFDETGRRYLDAYNNVPHVGHAHPAVVEAISRQATLLNTNTRYLHDNINELAERVAGTMPEGLEVCYFVNSASEANELALRLARFFTQAHDMLVTESAYHGHTTTLIDVSPYKHDGPAGNGPPDWVHTVPVADVYRGKHRNQATAAEDYADEVKKSISKMDRKLCGFIFESCPSVGGQILFPDGYLKLACQHVRDAGGLCLADEVQTGYGRLGSHMYGFEMQDVVPDIVMLGKPIGNGHPLAAVVTTREIADTFENGMEFFSTFGGNPVSCAAGLAVLKVLEEESLQENALVVGEQLLAGLRELQTRHALIGDVRGRGLFLGIELVKDQQSRNPGTGEAKFISDYCRENGVLIGTDGPDHNVLKIRPPMCFDTNNAKQLLILLEQAFKGFA